MSYQELREFLEHLGESGELHHVPVEVDPVLEIAEITDRMSKAPAGGKALLFERVRGSRFAAATNLFGSESRVCAALGVKDLSDLTRRVTGLLRQEPCSSSRDVSALLSASQEFTGFAACAIERGPCQEVVESVPDLAGYPLLKSWPGDGLPGFGGKFITLPLVFTRDPDTGSPNCGMYLVEVLTGNTIGIRWRGGSGGAAHWLKCRARREKMPVAVALGGDPALIFSASAPLADGIDEMHFAGFLRGRPVEMVQCLTSQLMVPAGAELVLEGEIEPDSIGPGGAFGNHTGFYTQSRDFPIMRITCITRRREPIFPATIVGRPPMEDCYIAKAVERLMLPFLRLTVPEIREICLPLAGIFHGAAIVALHKDHPGHAREVMQALWSSGWLAASRLLVVVDDDSDVKDHHLILWKVLNYVKWNRDLVMPGQPGEDSDSSAAPLPFGGRLGIDATRKSAEEGLSGEWPRELEMDDAVKERVTERWHEYGF